MVVLATGRLTGGFGGETLEADDVEYNWRAMGLRRLLGASKSHLLPGVRAFAAELLGRTVPAGILRSGPEGELCDKPGDRVKGVPALIRHMLLLPWGKGEDFAGPARAAAGTTARQIGAIKISRRFFGSFAAIMFFLNFPLLIRGLPVWSKMSGGRKG